jgi:hypothetical protein
VNVLVVVDDQYERRPRGDGMERGRACHACGG